MKSRDALSAGKALVIFATLLTVGCRSTVDAPRAEMRETTQIERTLDEVFAAAAAKDFERLDRYHLYGPRFTKFSGAAAHRLDASAARAGEHAGLGSLRGLKMRAEDLKIDRFGTVAIATFILEYSFESDAGTIRRGDRSTLVFVKEHGDWKIAHEHLSPID